MNETSSPTDFFIMSSGTCPCDGDVPIRRVSVHPLVDLLLPNFVLFVRVVNEVVVSSADGHRLHPQVSCVSEASCSPMRRAFSDPPDITPLKPPEPLTTFCKLSFALALKHLLQSSPWLRIDTNSTSSLTVAPASRCGCLSLAGYPINNAGHFRR